MPRLTIVEESLDHDVWGNYIDVEVADEDEELYILEIAGKHVKRKHRIMKDGKELKKSIKDRIDELRKKGRKPKKRGKKRGRRGRKP